MEKEFENVNMEHIGYDYREITVPRELSSLCLDSYPCFGWEQDPNQEMAGARHYKWFSQTHILRKRETVVLCFRRKRSISNKAELTRLQRNFDSCIAELQALERSKTTTGTISAWGIGLAGAAFMAGSVFAVTAEPPIIWLTILLAIPGFIGWIIPCFVYRGMVRKKTAEIDPLKEQKYDEIDAVCEKGSHLLH